MRLTILGKYGPYPQDANSACSGYLVEQDNTKLLIDCGSGVLGRLQSKINIKDLDAIYLTHLHFDHTSDILPLRYLLDDLNHKLTIITHLTNSSYEQILLNHPRFNIIDINESSNLDLGCLKLSFYKMEHPVVNHGILIKGDKNLGVTGDTVFCDNVIKLACESDYLLADCSKPIGFKGPHMSADKAIKILDSSNTKIFATHVTPNSDSSSIFKNEDRIITVEENATYEL